MLFRSAQPVMVDDLHHIGFLDTIDSLGSFVVIDHHDAQPAFGDEIDAGDHTLQMPGLVLHDETALVALADLAQDVAHDRVCVKHGMLAFDERRDGAGNLFPPRRDVAQNPDQPQRRQFADAPVIVIHYRQE